ncbi:MAG: HAD-IC family P-type ATPase [Desulforegulaceae bacterium]|nr:HAD-IC family P-type ATPase [Desulforegulaceae bacterium]
MFYTKNIEDCLKALDTSPNGLTSEEVKTRTKLYGKNSLPETKKQTLINVFFAQFKSPIIYILLIATLVSFFIKEFTDGFFILAVLFINAIIGTYQEYTAGERAGALKKVIKTFVIVLRDGIELEIQSEDLTLGDIVFFESGVKVPADIRLIDAYELYVNESLLTGESIDINKDSSYISTKPDEPVGDRKNMLYAGSMVTRGRAIGAVTAIGGETEIGKIADLLSRSKLAKAPLIERMERFSLRIASIIAIVVGIVFIIGIYQEAPLKDVFFFAVALAVSAIPEGLPVAITVALSIASASMSKRNVIVRKLSAIEGLGSSTLIASDKTGTLTQNLLSVEHFVTPKKTYTSKENIDKNVLLCSILCNESAYHKEDGEFKFLGDQVDVALARYALSLDNSLVDKHKNLTAINKLPYEPENKYSGMTYEIDNKKMHFIKGSPEVILSKSLLSKAEINLINEQVDLWAAKGFRNIALAYKISNEEEIASYDYTYLGFAAIADPLREGVAMAVKTAEKAGVKVCMVTGDHPNTAFFISEQLGIATNRDEVIDGVEISRWQEGGAKKEELANKRVFARVSPEQKQLIVQAFQALGHYVAVTGDGVNDAPALRHANIGISMGKSGTDVAREASDIILTDDSFGSIVNGIEEGRVAYDNIRKVIHLLISTGFAEVIMVLLSLLFFLPLPLLPVQLLWLNLVTNGFQDVALGLEKAEPGVLERKPRKPKEAIFNKVMISRVVVGGLYMGITAFALFYTLLNLGYQEDSARNLTLLLMVLFENIHVFNSRTEHISVFKINHLKNKFLWISVLAAQSVHIASMYIPFIESVLKTQPVSLKEWTMLLVLALTLLIVMEVEKIIRKNI